MKRLDEYIKEGLLDDDFDVTEDNVAWSMLVDLLGTEWNVSKNKTNIPFDYAVAKAKELVDHLNRFAPESNFNLSNQGKKVARLAKKDKDVVLSISINPSVGFVGLYLNSWSGQKYDFQFMDMWDAPSIRCSQWTNGYSITNQTYYFKVPKSIAQIIFDKNGTTFKG